MFTDRGPAAPPSDAMVVICWNPAFCPDHGPAAPTPVMLWSVTLHGAGMCYTSYCAT